MRGAAGLRTTGCSNRTWPLRDLGIGPAEYLRWLPGDETAAAVPRPSSFAPLLVVGFPPLLVGSSSSSCGRLQRVVELSIQALVGGRLHERLNLSGVWLLRLSN
jgi:hypothetical protein